MSEANTELTGPDLAEGVAVTDVPDGGSLLGHFEGEAVLLARQGDDLYAVGATCTHYSGPLAEGLVDGAVVHCPWHHARFCLRTGRALGPPALDPVAAYDLEREGERVRVTGKRAPSRPKPLAGDGVPERVVIVGAGAAGNAAAETLRNEGFGGSIALVGAEPTAPVDRPNLSKDYLAGDAPDEWIPLRSADFYREQEIDLVLQWRAVALDVAASRLKLDDGRTLGFDRLLLATGAEPVVLPIPGADLGHVHTLRSWSDSQAIIAQAARAQRVVVVGASFIGLEVAAALRARNLPVSVVALESQPLERVMGKAVGAWVRRLHEKHGVAFHLGRTVTRIDPARVWLDDDETLPADLVVLGVGVRPRTSLAQEAGLSVDNGVVVDAQLQTSADAIFAAGDVARWPDPRTGQLVRVEHWVVAERMGQVAARNLLGAQETFDAVPFFWSRHYDVSIHYVGHAATWERIDLAGDLEVRDCALAFRTGDRTFAVATVGRSLDAIRAELALERGDEETLRTLVPSASAS